MELHARYTFFAEGVRGSLTKGLFEKYDLRKDCEPQTYAIGIKELWEIEPDKHEPGKVIHTQGWPLSDVAGGGFIYHQDDHQLAIGFVVALDYKNPWLYPFEEMQRWKQHPAIRPCWKGDGVFPMAPGRSMKGGCNPSPALFFPAGR
nr:hypothetical protein [Iodidimonas nitroreducens]